MLRKTGMKRIMMLIGVLAVIGASLLTLPSFRTEAFAKEPVVLMENEALDAVSEASEAQSATGSKAWAAAIAIAVVAGLGAMGMALSIMKANEAIARQPEAQGSIRTALMLGLVFIETAIIYALIVAILIIFVL